MASWLVARRRAVKFFSLQQHANRVPAMLRRFNAGISSAAKAAFSVQGGGLSVAFASGAACMLPSTWLADQCRCPACYHKDTMQRLTEKSANSSHPPVQSCRVSDDGDSVTVTYAGAVHATVHPVSHLQLAASQTRTAHGAARETRPASSVPRRVPMKALASDAGVLQVLRDIERWGFAFIDGLEPTEKCTREVLQRIGFAQSTIFGDFWNFTVDTESTAERLEHADTAYTGLAIEPHTDGSYALEPPGLQSFHVLSYAGVAPQLFVESLLVDGFAVADEFRAAQPRAYELLCTVDLDWKYFEAGRSHLHCRAPVISLESSGAVKQIRWNHYDRGDLRHLLHQPALLLSMYDAIALWRAALLSTQHTLRYVLVPGTLVVFDNWRTLHGRAPFRGQRTLTGCYHDRQLFLSRLSVLRGEQPDAFA